MVAGECFAYRVQSHPLLVQGRVGGPRRRALSGTADPARSCGSPNVPRAGPPDLATGPPATGDFSGVTAPLRSVSRSLAGATSARGGVAGRAGRADNLVTQGGVSWADGKITAVREVPTGVPACAPDDVVCPQGRDKVVDAYDAADVQQCAQQLVQADPAGR